MSSPKRVLVPSPPSADTDVKYDSSTGRIYKDMDGLVERELIRIRQRMAARKAAAQTNGAAKAAAASVNGGDKPKE